MFNICDFDSRNVIIQYLEVEGDVPFLRCSPSKDTLGVVTLDFVVATSKFEPYAMNFSDIHAVLNNCDFSNNKGADTSYIQISQSATVEMNNCSFSGGYSETSASIVCNGSRTARSTHFVSNHSPVSTIIVTASSVQMIT